VKRIYLDNNATTPLTPEIFEYYISLTQTIYGNPSSVHHEGRDAKACLVEARKRVAHCLDVLPTEVFFFPSATEALNTALYSVLKKNPKGHVVTTNVEHVAVFEVLESESRLRPVTFIAVGETGAPTPKDIEEAIREDTCLVTCMSVNNETGVITDIEAIGAICARKGIPFIVDAVAHLGKAPLHIPKGVSCLVISGHKIHVPKGCAAVVSKAPFKLSSLLLGGHQEWSKRPGTENVPAYATFAKGLEIFKTHEDDSIHHLQSLRDRFEKALLSHIPGLLVNGSGERVSNVSNLSFPDLDAETFLMQLDMQGIAASHGSACSSGSLEPSRILTNMGYPRKRVLSAIRFSFGRQNTLEEVDEAVLKIVQILKTQR